MGEPICQHRFASSMPGIETGYRCADCGVPLATNADGNPTPVLATKPTDDWCTDCGRQTPHAGMSDAVCAECRSKATVAIGTTTRGTTIDYAGCVASGGVVTVRVGDRVVDLRDLVEAEANLTATQERCNALLAERRNGPGAIRVKRLTATAIVPKRAHDGDSGLDLHADIDAPVHILAGTTRLIPTGIAVAIPKGYEGQVRPRSGLAVRSSAAAFLGTIDSTYRGDVGVIMHAHGPNSITVKPGDRIGQLVFAPVCLATLVEVDALEETERGAAGFGSSGIGART